MFLKFLKKKYSKRVEIALNVKESAVNDFYGGWHESDLELLSRYKYNKSNIKEVLSGEIIDWLGVAI